MSGLTKQERDDAVAARALRRSRERDEQRTYRTEKFTDQLNDLLGEWILESELTREEMCVILAKSIAELMSPR